jgi:hypothetical protein
MTLSALGIFSAAGAGGLGAYELISTAFGTGSSGVITFSSIPSDYKHLQIRYTAKNSSTANRMNLTMNGITSASYAGHNLLGNGTSATSTAFTSQTAAPMVESMSAAGTNFASAGVIDILDYNSTTKNKTIKAIYGMVAVTNRLYLMSGALFNTAAVTSITLTTSANNFDSVSRFSLYGIKG